LKQLKGEMIVLHEAHLFVFLFLLTLFLLLLDEKWHELWLIARKWRDMKWSDG
jgi:hypothetical protein